MGTGGEEIHWDVWEDKNKWAGLAYRKHLLANT